MFCATSSREPNEKEVVISLALAEQLVTCFSFLCTNQKDMKIWSPLFATALILAGVSAQFDEEDGFSIEMIDDDYDE